MKVFLDSNVILDVLAGRQPFFADCQRVMVYCERNLGSGMASVLTFCTVAYVLRKSLGRDQMAVMLRNLRKFIAVLPMSDGTVDWAIDSGCSDFEDAMQYDCAATGLADVIVTRDQTGFSTSQIPVITPAEFASRYL
jgi:predicted nucleic acid-binding protein